MDYYFNATGSTKSFMNPWNGLIVASTDDMLSLATDCAKNNLKSVLVDARPINNFEVNFDQVGNYVLNSDSLAGVCFPTVYNASAIYPISGDITLQTIGNVPYLKPHVANRFLSERLLAYKLMQSYHFHYSKFYMYLPIHVVRKAARKADAEIAFVQLQGDCSTLDTLLAKTSDLVLNPIPLFKQLIESDPLCDVETWRPWCYNQRCKVENCKLTFNALRDLLPK